MVHQSRKLSGICYEIRGPINTHAQELEARGEKVLHLNTGNPAPFGFEPPPALLEAMQRALVDTHGYSDSRGLLVARQELAETYQARGFDAVGPDEVFLGNGVSELASMVVQALVDDGDEVLIPAPDYPLWTAVTQLAGGRAVHYTCHEDDGWLPDVADVESRVTARTKALLLINPNNPTGAVYPRHIVEELVEVARRHRLVLLVDEIYDRIIYDGHHVHAGPLSPDVLTLTFSGLSKSHRVAGYRSGWMVASGPTWRCRDFLEGLSTLASMRLCPNVPAQSVIPAALADHTVDDMCRPGGRLYEQAVAAHTALEQIPGVTCAAPRGALYAFPRIDPYAYRIRDDERFVLDLLKAQHIHVVQGSGFNLDQSNHFRLITLPERVVLEDAIARIGEFLSTYRQD